MSEPSVQSAWRPGIQLEVARHRESMIREVHAFFSAREVLLVDTPARGRNTVTDPNIESIRTEETAGRTLFLQSSPEYYMKRMLAAGFPDIYQVGKVFRAGENGSRHLNEFTLLEWYRQGFSLREIMRETTLLIGTALGRTELAADATLVSYADAFTQHANLDVFGCNHGTISDALNADRELKISIGDDRDTWLDLALTELVAPKFATDGLTVLHHYPARQAALARLCPDDIAVADRFEVFFGELELANGFVELVNVDEQKSRFERDQQLRKGRGRSVPDVDLRLLAALQHGLPPCAGVAVGFDRMLMIKSATGNIQDVVGFSRELSGNA